MFKKIAFGLLVATITFITVSYAHPPKKRYQPSSPTRACTMVGVVSNVTYDPTQWNGYLSGQVAFYCSGNGVNNCSANMFYHLWYEFPSGWDVVISKCTDVSLQCGQSTTLYPNMKNLSSSVPGNYYFEVDALTGTCTGAPGTVMSWEGIYFKVPAK